MRQKFFMLLATATLSTQFLILHVGSIDARADEHEGCAGFSWPLDAELKMMSAAAVEIKNGDEVAGLPNTAVQLTLAPAATVSLPVAPGVKPSAIPPSSFSGWLRVADVPAGAYQITISRDGWIDAAQDGTLLESAGFTGSRNCKILHKSVRYHLNAGPVIVQLSGVPADSVKITLRRAD